MKSGLQERENFFSSPRFHFPQIFDSLQIIIIHISLPPSFIALFSLSRSSFSHSHSCITTIEKRREKNWRERGERKSEKREKAERRVKEWSNKIWIDRTDILSPVTTQMNENGKWMDRMQKNMHHRVQHIKHFHSFSLSLSFSLHFSRERERGREKEKIKERERGKEGEKWKWNRKRAIGMKKCWNQKIECLLLPFYLQNSCLATNFFLSLSLLLSLSLSVSLSLSLALSN